MYLEHFGLREAPFGITPDTGFAFAGAAHQEALNTLLIAVHGGEGFIKVTGEVGTGKTLLCRRFLATLGEDCVSAYLPNPCLEAETLLRALAEELGVEASAQEDPYHYRKRLGLALLDFAREGKRVVVCIDEAQAMPLASLEALRLLSNLETEKRKLLQLVLFGQPELDEKLRDPSVRQLRQRIAFHCRLGGLGKRELEHYLAHRLRVAGYRGSRMFSLAAVRLLHRASGGTPRLVNILAHKALLAAYGQGRQDVGRSQVAAAVRDTEGARAPVLWF
ncbi:MAG: MSHA fimbrial biogenesis protein MshM [Rhodocyclaceae bacterium]